MRGGWIMGDGKDAPPYGLLHEGRGPRLATLGRLRGAQRDPYSPVEFTMAAGAAAQYYFFNSLKCCAP